MTTRPSNEQIKQQALRANKAAELNEKLRKHISSSFDDLELDQAQTPDRVDQSNWSWLENGSEMYHLGMCVQSSLLCANGACVKCLHMFHYSVCG